MRAFREDEKMEKIFSMDGPYARAMNFLWSILVISVLWLLCSLPVFTLGAASTAAYYAAAKAVRHHTGTVHREFFASFKRNVRQSIPLTLALLFLTVLLGLECLYLYSDPAIPLPVLCLFVVMLLCLLGCGSYLWAALSRFDQRSFALFRFSLVVTFRHILTTVSLLFLLLSCLVGVYFLPWGVLLFPGLSFYLSTYPMERILLRYSPPKSEDDKEAEKWYYQ